MTLLSTVGQLQACSVRVIPRTPLRNLAESKTILTAFQKFGEVVAFSNEKYDTTHKDFPSSRAIEIIYDSPHAAQSAINSSPIHVDFPPKRKPNFNNANVGAGTRGRANADANYTDAISETLEPQTDQFFMKCTVRPSTTIHEIPVQRNPFFRRFEQDVHSPEYKDLVKKLKGDLTQLADAPMARKKILPISERMRAHFTANQLGGGSLMWLWELGQGRGMEKGREGQLADSDRQEKEIHGDGDEKSKVIVELKKIDGIGSSMVERETKMERGIEERHGERSGRLSQDG